MTSGVKLTDICQMSPGTVSVDITGTALPAGISDQQRLDFYLFQKPIRLADGEFISPVEETVEPQVVTVVVADTDLASE